MQRVKEGLGAQIIQFDKKTVGCRTLSLNGCNADVGKSLRFRVTITSVHACTAAAMKCRSLSSLIIAGMRTSESLTTAIRKCSMIARFSSVLFRA